MLWQIKSRLRGYKVFVQQPPNGFHLHMYIHTIALKIFLINKKKERKWSTVRELLMCTYSHKMKS